MFIFVFKGFSSRRKCVLPQDDLSARRSRGTPLSVCVHSASMLSYEVHPFLLSYDEFCHVESSHYLWTKLLNKLRD